MDIGAEEPLQPIIVGVTPQEDGGINRNAFNRVLESTQVVGWRRWRLACRLHLRAQSTGMDRLLSFTPPFGSHLSRLAGIAIGLTLLWYGSSQISVAGLVVMLIGLIAAVSAAALPRLSSRPRERPGTLALTVDMRAPHAQS